MTDLAVRIERSEASLSNSQVYALNARICIDAGVSVPTLERVAHPAVSDCVEQYYWVRLVFVKKMVRIHFPRQLKLDRENGTGNNADLKTI